MDPVDPVLIGPLFVYYIHIIYTLHKVKFFVVIVPIIDNRIYFANYWVVPGPLDPVKLYYDRINAIRLVSKNIKTKISADGIIVCLLVLSITARAGEKHKEKWCQAHRGRIEVTLPDKTRCDCITGSNAIEFDFAHKWAESIGQALYNSLQTGKRGGVVLILFQP